MQLFVASILWITYTFHMIINTKEKRNELIWAISLQGYTYTEIGSIFNVDKSTVMRIINAMPAGWETKWKKI